MPKKLKQDGDPELHEDLEGFHISVNRFGEVEGSMGLDRINSFLNASEFTQSPEHGNEEEE